MLKTWVCGFMLFCFVFSGPCSYACQMPETPLLVLFCLLCCLWLYLRTIPSKETGWFILLNYNPLWLYWSLGGWGWGVKDRRQSETLIKSQSFRGHMYLGCDLQTCSLLPLFFVEMGRLEGLVEADVFFPWVG